MTRGQLNKYIEELKIEAIRKVKDDCELARNDRKLKIVEKSNMTAELKKIQGDMENVILALKNLRLTAGNKSSNRHWGIINNMEGQLEYLNAEPFLSREEILERDPKTIAIFELEKQSIKAVTENYDTLRENCKVYKNSAEAVEYLQTLGFTVPDYEAPKKLMKPLDTRFLIMKGTNKEEEDN